MKGADLIHRLATALAPPKGKLSDKELADRLDVVPLTLQNWRSTKEMKASIVAKMLAKACKKARVSAERSALLPIAEFFPINPVIRYRRLELFDTRPPEGGAEHPYRRGLRDMLEKSHGVYIFYDSRGRALYSGKAEKTKLWSEMNNALNRTRRDVQQVKRVQHPKSRKAFALPSEKVRQIHPQTVKLSEIAAYVSAYQVSQRLIGTVESLLIRSFANDLLNVKMERFGGGLQNPKDV